ncbi:MAG: hypothetical protein CMJ18_23315 [Phycisphaeraceae bacterium]|nr:hypothetical protein [Phycisphaeraceae bacterium]
MTWTKDVSPAIEPPPDDAIDPRPETEWDDGLQRTGVYGAVTPNLIATHDGRLRMYYTQILPRPEFPAGANDYYNATTRILSAVSRDGATWTAEVGIRLEASQCGVDTLRVVSPEVVPLGDGTYRMYFERCDGAGSGPSPSSLRSAISRDGGMTWIVEPGRRMGADGARYISPRLILLDDGRQRLYYAERGEGIRSALSDDDGLTFKQEAGLRIEYDMDGGTAFAPEILRIQGAGYRMYFASYGASNRASILSAVSEDGLAWQRETEPAVESGGKWDRAKASEMCVALVPDREGSTPRYRMFYEACDGTAPDARGVWRIASATTPG